MLAEGLLAEPDTEDGRRPADVLVCAELGPPTEAERAGARPATRHALDFAVVNPLGLTRASLERGSARPRPLAAARAYAADKRSRVAQRCEAAGVRFHAMVLESTGGVEDREAAPIFHRVAMAVAEREGVAVEVAKGELLQRISLELARSAARAVLRRAPKARSGMGDRAAAFLRGEAMLTAPDED